MLLFTTPYIQSQFDRVARDWFSLVNGTRIGHAILKNVAKDHRSPSLRPHSQIPTRRKVRASSFRFQIIDVTKYRHEPPPSPRLPGGQFHTPIVKERSQIMMDPKELALSVSHQLERLEGRGGDA